jgi:hypothetical protein
VATLIATRTTGHGLKNDVSRFTMATLRVAGLHAKETELDRCGAAANTQLDPAAAHLVEHGDFFEGAQGMVQVQQHHQRSKAQVGGPLRHGSQKQIW